jgi:hypothetical protein
MAYVGNSPTQQSFTGGVDQYNGNNSNTVFGLTRTINTVYDVDAYVENVWQRPATGYTVSANTITFTSAPPAGSNNVVVVYRNFAATSIVPQQGSVTHTAFAANAIPTALGYMPANKAGDTFSGAVSGITTLAAGNTTITGTANVSQGLTSNTLTTSTNTATFGTAVYHVANGNVGFGTASPTNILTVAGSSSLGTASASGNTSLYQAPGSLFLTMNTNGTLSGARRNWAISPEYDVAGALSFSVGTSEAVTPTSPRLIIKNQGAVILSGGTTSADGTGISFPSSQNASSDANTLDDYEEGTWTPDVVNNGKTSTWAARNGIYRKVGGHVTAWGQVETGASGATSGGALIIGGLPFNINSAGSAAYQLGTVSCSTLTNTPSPIFFYGGASSGCQIWFANLSGQDQTRLTTTVAFFLTYFSS